MTPTEANRVNIGLTTKVVITDIKVTMPFNQNSQNFAILMLSS